VARVMIDLCRGTVYRMDVRQCEADKALARYCDRREGRRLYFVGEQGLVNMEAAQREWMRNWAFR
jgi:hypothetical protein